MSIRFTRRRLLIASALLVLALGGLYAFVAYRVRRALDAESPHASALSFQPLSGPPTLPRWGGGEVEALAASGTSLLSAGGSGIWDESGDISGGLPTLKASALCLWRGRAVVALAAGGLFLRRENRWEEARTSLGELHVRCLLESPGGELLIGAQEGLFRAPWGSARMECLDPNPVRSLALDQGLLLAGGEQGLRRIEGGHADPLSTPDPWVDFVGLRGRDVVVCTPQGLAVGPLGGTLLPLAGGQEATGAALLEGQIYAASEGRLLRFDPAGRAAEEFLPSPPRKVFASAGSLFADTPNGLYRKAREGWSLARPRPPCLPPGPSHITAMTAFGGRLALGLFDGGLVSAGAQGDSMAFAPMPGVPGSQAWGVNALLPAGGALYVASLRGTARHDGSRMEPLGAAGGAGGNNANANGNGVSTIGGFALVQGREGLFIGTGQGLALPDGRFLSAFHGLPGNQVLALAEEGGELFVGTPSGLGAVREGKVLWRAVSGDGRLPHPWVTALALHRQALYIGTYGGGVARRSPLPQQPGSPGVFDPFPETSGLKINPGCLLAASGQLFLGTDGQGLWRLEGERFARLALGLPSPRITALYAEGEWLYIGTDQGLTRLSIRSLPNGA